jgi:hypothetical protein
MFWRKFLLFLVIFFLLPSSLWAEGIDSDNDGLTDEEEINTYLTNPNNSDTDGDGFNDKLELINGFSPLYKNNKLIEVDTDNDGLSDGLELAFGTKINNPDTDGDGFSDGEEIKNGYNPKDPSPKKLEKKIEVDLSDQQLSYFLGKVKLGTFVVSTGTKNNPTPLGEFAIQNKNPEAKSKVGNLLMPYWMAFYKGLYAIHDLPVWDNGKKETTEHLGKPASHGCVRLATEDAKFLYNWTPIGTRVIIKN